jgi:hypothetical protein
VGAQLRQQLQTEERIPEQGPDRDWRYAYRHVRQRLDNHRASAHRRGQRYKSIATSFHVAIPLLSVTVMVVVGSGISDYREIVFTLGTALTVVTTLNTTLAPARRYREAVERCIELHDLRFQLEKGVEELALKHAQPTALLTLIDEINLGLSEIGRHMADETYRSQAP